MQLTDHDGGLAVAPEQATALLEALLEYGATVVDTAEFYGDGALNRLLGKVIAGRHDKIVLSTKVGAVFDQEARLRVAQRPKELRAQVEANLTSTGAERLDIVFIRRTDFPPGIIATGDQIVPIEDQLAELTALRDEGKIATIALSQVNAEHVSTALDADIVAIQNPHSLLDRDHEDVLDLCRRHGLAWMPYFPLGGNFPGRTKVTEVPEVIAIAGELGITPSQLGLAWHLHNYERAVLIPGTSSIQHLAENMAAAEIELTQEVLTRLAAVSPRASR